MKKEERTPPHTTMLSAAQNEHSSPEEASDLASGAEPACFGKAAHSTHLSKAFTEPENKLSH